MSRYLIISVLAMFVAIRICAQSQVRMALPKTQTMVHNSLSKSRANKSKKANVQFTIPKDLLAKMFGFCGVSVSNDTTGLALSVDTCATKREVKKSLSEATDEATDNELTALDVLNMLVPGAFSDKEKEQWKSLPKETRKAIMDMVLTPGATQWDALNEAQKAVVHEYSNGK